MARAGGWQCSGCLRRFSSITAFDMHRVGEFKLRNHTRRCLAADEMRDRGMVCNERGAWTTGREFGEPETAA